ncbi:MAG: substrate-binding domain-containing protein [Chloroflexi bacterium]|nr:substrate-binding domain-containing protein [Chloroflexota bacterium]
MSGATAGWWVSSSSLAPPTAVFASSWLHTLGMLSVVNRLPDAERRRFGLIGTGAGEYLDASAPWMTQVEIPAREQGRIAIDLLFSLLDGATEQRGQEIVLPMRLVERESTAPPSAPSTSSPKSDAAIPTPSLSGPACRCRPPAL